jgi:hypothetical protein
VNISPLGANAISVGKLNGSPPYVTFFHADELESSSGTPVSAHSPSFFADRLHEPANGRELYRIASDVRRRATRSRFRRCDRVQELE